MSPAKALGRLLSGGDPIDCYPSSRSVLLPINPVCTMSWTTWCSRQNSSSADPALGAPPSRLYRHMPRCPHGVQLPRWSGPLARIRSPRPLTATLGGVMRATIIDAAALLLAGCTSPEMTPEQRREMLDRTTGTIVGTVREAGTNQALEGVFVSSRYLGDQTNADGR